MSNSIGDLRNSGLQGNNFPWQLKMLEGLQKIYDEVKKPLTCAEDSVNLCVPGGGLPVSIDCNDRISLCVNGAIVDATNSLPVTVVNPLPLEVNINQANDSILIYGFDGTTNQAVSVTPTGQLNVRPLTCTDVVSLCFDNGGTPTTVSDTNPLPVNAIVTVPSALDTALFAFDITSGVNEALTTTETSPGTHALDVNVTSHLDCTTDSIAICDGAGNSLVINNPGGPADGSINSVLVDLTTGNPAVINPDGTQNNAIYGYDPVSVQNEAITSTAISPTVQALDVNIANSVALNTRALDCTTDSVKICDGLGNALDIETNGSINTNLYAEDLISGATELLTTTGGAGYQALDVNIVQPNVAISLGSLVQTATTGDLSLFGASITSITFQNIGTAVANVSVDGGLNFFPVAPGTVINLDPRVPMGYYNGTSFYWDTTTVGASLLIIYNYI